jgi:hypothetical protein
MSTTRRLLTMAVATAAAMIPLTATGAAIAAPATHGSGPVPAAKPGRTGNTITLDNKAEFSGYDAASDASGRAYVGWISDKGSPGRQVHLCTLPRGARRCAGGIQTINSLGASTAQGLRVLVTPGGKVTLVWMIDTVASENGPQGSEIVTATSHSGGPLSPATEMATAPSFGTMLDATLGPNNSIWVLTEHSVVGGIQVRPGLGNPFVNLKTPYGVGDARVRFAGGTAVLVIQKAGAISTPVAFASSRNGGFTGFRKLAHTWTAASDIGLTGTRSGVRLVTSEGNANYHPVAWSWSGGGFGRATLTGDFNACSPSSHDLVSDSSGRAADVSNECDDLAIANMPDTRHAVDVRFNVHGTFAGGDPQLTTTPRGTGWVVWSIESTIANKLMVAPVLLPGLNVTAAKTVRGNRVVVTGPTSCLPPVDTAVGVKGHPAKHWHVVSSVLRLGSTVLHSATLRGGTLKAGARYTLSGTVRFANGGSHVTVTATLKFRSCPNA